MKIHKKFPKGTKLAPGYDELSIWGDRMARVEAPYWDTDDPAWFDPEAIAKRYDVYLSDLPADEKLVGQSHSFYYGHKTLYEQPFLYRPRGAMGSLRGQLEEPFPYWVEVAKFRDLSSRQRAAVLRVLDRKGYAEAYRKPLSATKWRRLLPMSFFETQDQDYELANAAYALIEQPGISQTDEQERRRWDNLAGVYALTKKGDIKFIVSRKPSKKGL